MKARRAGSLRRRPLACTVTLVIAATGLSAGPAASVAEQRDRPYAITEQRTRCAEFAPTRRPLFGDTHVHTAYSFDASSQDTRNTPRDAYRFARGEPMGIQPYDENGAPLRTIQLARPLDFTAVTDHAELLGEIDLCMTPGSPAAGSWMCWLHHNYGSLGFRLWAARNLVLRGRWGLCGDEGELCLEAEGRIWKAIRAAAEEAYDRSAACRFTSFVGYEWTAILEDGINLHRNVIFRNERVPARPISWVDTPSAAVLWERLQSDCVDGIPGCDALTIPHNSNISAGLMFESAKLASTSDEGLPVTAEEARLRNRWEPVVEIFQHKGDSECRVGADTSDELCGFEVLAYDRFGPKFSSLARRRDAEAPNFVRFALRKGLAMQQSLGANPLKYGILASTDTHIGAPGFTDERAPTGHGGAGVGAGEGVPEGFPDDLEFNPGGLAVVWAEENTRDSIFAGMQRREVYGTSGTRPVVRFFGGWELPDDLCGASDFAARGYAGGVPMGGDLPARGTDPGAPRFAVSALRDAGANGAPGTPLQRIQIVKGWLENGEPRERVVDVAGGPNGAQVDTRSCIPKGAGADRLCTVWTDPDFDPAVPAFYYARVLENPTCRWSQYICNAARIDCAQPDAIPDALEGCCASTHRPSIQERAWTSPIWYTPGR